jgi:hypothetical protein
MTTTSSDILLRLKAEMDYDQSGARKMQHDLLQLQVHTTNAENKIVDIQRRIKEFQAQGIDTRLLPDIDREAMDMIQVLNKLADEYAHKADELSHKKVVSKESVAAVREFAEELRTLAGNIDVLQSYLRDESGALKWQPMGQAQKLAEVFDGAIAKRDGVVKAFNSAYVEMDRVHRTFYERMSARSEKLTREQEQLSQIVNQEGWSGTISSVTRLADGLGKLSLGLQNARADYERLQKEIAIAARGDDPLAASPQQIQKAAEAMVQALTRQKVKMKELLADPALAKMFDGEVMEAALKKAVKAIDNQIAALKNSLDYVPSMSFMGQDFERMVGVFEAGSRKAGRVLKDFADATRTSAGTASGAFAEVELSSVKAGEAIRHLPGLEGVFETNALNNAGAKFTQAMNALVLLKKEFGELQRDFKGKPLAILEAEDTNGFIERFKHIHVGLTATGSLLKQLHTNPSLSALFPPEAVDVLLRAQKEVDNLAARITSGRNQKSGSFLDTGLNESAYVGALGAIQVGIHNVEVAMQGAGNETRELSVNLDLALAQLDSGVMLNRVKALQSLNLTMQGINRSARDMATELPTVAKELGRFTDEQLAEMAAPRSQFTDADQYEQYMQRFTKAYDHSLGLLKEYQDELGTLDKQLGRYIETGEKFGIVSPDDLAKAREYQEIVRTLREASPAELRSLDVSAVAQQARDYMGVNQQNMSATAIELGKMGTALTGNLALVRELAGESHQLANGPAAAARSMDELTSRGTETGGVIERMREKAAAAKSEIDGMGVEMDDLSGSAVRAAAATDAAVTAQDQLAASTQKVGNAAQDTGHDLATINAELAESRQQSREAGTGFRDYGHEADLAAGKTRELEAAAGDAGGGIDDFGHRVRATAEGPIKVWEKNTDEMLRVMKEATSFKDLGQRFEEDARRIIEEQEAIRLLTGSYKHYLEEQKKAGSGGTRFEQALKSVGATVLDLNGDMREAHEAMTRFGSAWRDISQKGTVFSKGTSLINQLFPAGDETRLAGIRDRLTGVTDRLHDWRTEMKLVKAGILETENNLYKAMGVMGKLKSNIVEGLFHGVGYELTNAMQMAVMAVKQFVKDAALAYKDFSKGMAEIYTIVPEASGYMRDKLADDVASITTTFGYLQNEVLPAAYQALSLGVEAP